MNIIIKNRGKGKTTRLIYESERTGAIIVVPTKDMVKYVASLAKDMEATIPDPILIEDAIERRHRELPEDERYLIDEAPMCLDNLLHGRVDAVTLSQED